VVLISNLRYGSEASRAPTLHMNRVAKEIHAGRLIGRAPRREDFQFLRMLLGDPRATATLSTNKGRPFTEDATRAALESTIEHWRRHGFGVRYFFAQSGNEFIGYCGLRHAAVERRDEIELLYAVRAERWRMGYGVEMARAALSEGFETLGFQEVVAFTLPANAGSRGVMERCGMRYERDFVHAGLPHVLYRIRREEFAPARGGQV
jgi:RimJ/RimL family protein N-acetyltransferase